MSPASSSSEDHKQKVAMGYPSMDRYNQAQYMFPPQQSPPQPPPPLPSAVYPIPCGGPPQGYASSSNPNFLQPYATLSPNHHDFLPPYASSSSSYHFPLGYHDPSVSPYQNDPKYLSSASKEPYTQQPYNDFYYPQQHYKPLVPETNHASSFGRVMLILMVVLVASMCMMTLVMWFLFGTYIPEFEIVSLKVSNFSVTNTTLAGTWDVDVSVSNTNKDLAISFDRIMSSIFYKEALLGISAVQTFQVPQMQQREFNFSLVAEQTPGDNKLQSWVLPTLVHDHSNGMVVFSLRLALKANFTTSNMVYRQESIRVLCENMQVMFSMVNGEGTLSPGLGNTCLIRIHDGLKEY